MAQSNQDERNQREVRAFKKEPERVWVVVVVESGIPVLIEAHHDEKTAKRREKHFRKDMREDYDAVGVFEVAIGSKVSI